MNRYSQPQPLHFIQVALLTPLRPKHPTLVTYTFDDSLDENLLHFLLLTHVAPTLAKAKAKMGNYTLILKETHKRVCKIHRILYYVCAVPLDLRSATKV